jgi:hypothetical protein
MLQRRTRKVGDGAMTDAVTSRIAKSHRATPTVPTSRRRDDRASINKN